MMLKIISVLMQLVPVDFTLEERHTLQFIIESIINSTQAGNTAYELTIGKINHINQNIQEYALDLLRRSGLFMELKAQAADNNLVKYPFVIYHHLDGQILLYFNRYFLYETETRKKIRDMLAAPPANINNDVLKAIPGLLGTAVNAAQQQAVMTCITNKFSIITGGPGVGKTTTIKMFLKVIAHFFPDYKVSISTPTGKATNRIRALLSAQDQPVLQDFIADSVTFSTMHALLGLYPGYRQLKRVTSDIIIIDEVSMMSLFLFYHLLGAIEISKIKHLIFIGDVNQLPAIEVGNVFPQLIAQYPQIVSVLALNLRSNASIIELALQIRNKNYPGFLQTVAKFDNLAVQELSFPALLQRIFDPGQPSYHHYLDRIKLLQDQENLTATDLEQLFKLYNDFIILCLLNIGQYGVDNMNNVIEQLILYFLAQPERVKDDNTNNIYVGKPIIINRNHQQLGLYNGDIGIMVRHNDIYCAAFASGSSYQFYPVEMLPQYSLAYAITVHKTQGSEFNNILLLIPEFKYEAAAAKTGIEIYNNQILYTAVTRARQGVTICAGPEQLQYLIENSYQRR